MKHFKSAILRLTLLYALILMVLSISLSIWMYNKARLEVRTVIDHQQALIGPMTVAPVSGVVVDESSERLALTLVFFNLMVLGGGLLISYYLARATLRPIQKSYEVQEAFASSASHELRTPLTALKMELQVALRQSQIAPAEAKRVIGSALEEVNRLSRLSGQLLLLAHPDQVTKPGGSLHADIAKAASVAGARLKAQAAKKQIAIKISPASKQAAIDADDLCEVLTILLDNAIKYSHPKTTVWLTAYSTRQGVVIEVKDEGPGIAIEDKQHIFERFYRSAHTPRDNEGHGLGLAIARQIIENAGGSIDAANNDDTGATFTIKLPV